MNFSTDLPGLLTTSGTHLIGDEEENDVHLKGLSILLMFFSSIFGLVSNIYAAWKFFRSQEVLRSYPLIAHLIVLGVIISGVYAPLSIARQLGLNLQTMCQAEAMLWSLCEYPMYISVAVTAIQRYRRVDATFRERPGQALDVASMICSWLVSIPLTIYVSHFFNLRFNPDDPVCLSFPYPGTDLSAVSLVGLIVTVLIMAISYMRCIVFLKNRIHNNNVELGCPEGEPYTIRNPARSPNHPGVRFRMHSLHSPRDHTAALEELGLGCTRPDVPKGSMSILALGLTSPVHCTMAVVNSSTESRSVRVSTADDSYVENIESTHVEDFTQIFTGPEDVEEDILDAVEDLCSITDAEDLRRLQLAKDSGPRRKSSLDISKIFSIQNFRRAPPQSKVSEECFAGVPGCVSNDEFESVFGSSGPSPSSTSRFGHGRNVSPNTVGRNSNASVVTPNDIKFHRYLSAMDNDLRNESPRTMLLRRQWSQMTNVSNGPNVSPLVHDLGHPRIREIAPSLNRLNSNSSISSGEFDADYNGQRQHQMDCLRVPPKHLAFRQPNILRISRLDSSGSSISSVHLSSVSGGRSSATASPHFPMRAAKNSSSSSRISSNKQLFKPKEAYASSFASSSTSVQPKEIPEDQDDKSTTPENPESKADAKADAQNAPPSPLLKGESISTQTENFNENSKYWFSPNPIDDANSLVNSHKSNESCESVSSYSVLSLNPSVMSAKYKAKGKNKNKKGGKKNGGKRLKKRKGESAPQMTSKVSAYRNDSYPVECMREIPPDGCSMSPDSPGGTNPSFGSFSQGQEEAGKSKATSCESSPRPTNKHLLPKARPVRVSALLREIDSRATPNVLNPNYEGFHLHRDSIARRNESTTDPVGPMDLTDFLEMSKQDASLEHEDQVEDPANADKESENSKKSPPSSARSSPSNAIGNNQEDRIINRQTVTNQDNTYIRHIGSSQFGSNSEENVKIVLRRSVLLFVHIFVTMFPFVTVKAFSSSINVDDLVKCVPILQALAISCYSLLPVAYVFGNKGIMKAIRRERYYRLARLLSR